MQYNTSMTKKMIIYNDEDDYENGFNTARYRVQARVQKHNQT